MMLQHHRHHSLLAALILIIFVCDVIIAANVVISGTVPTLTLGDAGDVIIYRDSTDRLTIDNTVYTTGTVRVVDLDSLTDGLTFRTLYNGSYTNGMNGQLPSNTSDMVYTSLSGPWGIPVASYTGSTQRLVYAMDYTSITYVYETTGSTVATWLQCVSGSYYQPLVALTGTQSHCLQVFAIENGRPLWYDYQQGGYGIQLTEAPKSVCDGRWHHVAATRSSSAWRLYVDGRAVTEVATSSFSTSWVQQAATEFDQLDIGSLFMDVPTIDTWTAFSGQMYDTRIYNTTLTGKQISQLIRATQPQYT